MYMTLYAYRLWSYRFWVFQLVLRDPTDTVLAFVQCFFLPFSEIDLQSRSHTIVWLVVYANSCGCRIGPFIIPLTHLHVLFTLSASHVHCFFRPFVICRYTSRMKGSFVSLSHCVLSLGCESHLNFWGMFYYLLLNHFPIITKGS